MRVEDPDDLRARLEAFVKFKNIAQNRKDRLEDLMNRRSAQKWDALKKARMVRKYVATQQDIDESLTTIDQLEFRLSQITTA